MSNLTRPSTRNVSGLVPPQLSFAQQQRVCHAGWGYMASESFR